MIGKEGSYYIEFSINSIKDFIDINNLEDVKIFTESGNILPVLQITFGTNELKILNYLNYGNIIDFSFGKDKNKMKTVKAYIIKCNVNPENNDKLIITVNTILHSFEYLNSTNSEIINGTSIFAIDKVLKRIFTDISIDNTLVPQDKQNWINANNSNRNFIMDIMLHSYIKDTFINIGISEDGKVIIRDIKNYIAQHIQNKSQKAKFIFTDNIGENDTYQYQQIRHNYDNGFSNYMVGNNKVLTTNLLDEDNKILSKTNILPMLSSNSDIENQEMYKKKFFYQEKDNTHEKYYSAYFYNVSQLMLYSSLKVEITITDNMMSDLHILDLVYLKNNQYLSGFYYVIKKAIVIDKSNINTVLLLARETFNKVDE